MNYYKIEKIPAKPAASKEVFDYKECDICKEKGDYDGFSERPYEIHSVKIQYKYGASYPEGGHLTREYFDICPTCFEREVVPFLESLGCKKYEEESDW